MCNNTETPEVGLYWALEKLPNDEYRRDACIVEITGGFAGAGIHQAPLKGEIRQFGCDLREKPADFGIENALPVANANDGSAADFRKRAEGALFC